MTLEDLKNMEKESTPPSTPPKENITYAENKHTLDDAKTALEVKRLEFEQKKLEMEIAKFGQQSPTDAFKIILDMKDAFNAQLLNMQKQNFDTEIRLARLAAEQDNETALWLDFLEPYIPNLLGGLFGNQKRDSVQSDLYVHNDKGELIPNPNLIKESKPNTIVQSSTPPGENIVPSSEQKSTQASDYQMDIQEYQEKVKRGEISLDQAWKEFQYQKENLPRYVRNISFEEFKEMYDKLRNGK